jgi:DNA-binding MarR family transcriptional regulator
MNSRRVGLRRIPINKLCDIFAKVVDVVLTERALIGAPCQDLSRSQWEGILFILRHESCSIRELAEGLGVSHPAAVKMVERLVRKDLVDRHESEQDRRVVQLTVSDLGRQCIEHVREQRGNMMERIMAQMDAQQTAALSAALQDFIESALRDCRMVEAVCLHCGVEHLDECLVHQVGDELKAPTTV